MRVQDLRDFLSCSWEAVWDHRVARVMLNVLKKHMKQRLLPGQTVKEGLRETVAAPVARD